MHVNQQLRIYFNCSFLNTKIYSKKLWTNRCAQADLSLRSAHKQSCKKCHASAHFFFFFFFFLQMSLLKETSGTEILCCTHFAVDSWQKIHMLLVKNITASGELRLWFPTALHQIENWNQKSQVTGQGYIYACIWFASRNMYNSNHYCVQYDGAAVSLFFFTFFFTCSCKVLSYNSTIFFLISA